MKLSDMLEENIRKEVILLRDHGFNTFSSCGCEKPYIQMEIYEDSDITKLYNLLIENKYNNFILDFQWNITINKRFLIVTFEKG